MNEIITKENIKIEDMIYEVRGKQVMIDRFIIIDNKSLYNCGASFKDLGKKCFAINKIEDKKILKELESKL